MITETQTAIAARTGKVLDALRSASRKTGLDFDYLLNTAMRESSLNAHAKSKTSSATGLFQFIEQTWLGLVKRHGERYGLGAYAKEIEQDGNGRYTVASSETKAAILALRKDPELSAVMAGESAKATKQSLECVLGREVCGGELYAAHFLGPKSARELIQLNECEPQARADLAFPAAAKANKSIFYRADGTPKSVSEVYACVVDRAPPSAMPAIAAVVKAPMPASVVQGPATVPQPSVLPTESAVAKTARDMFAAFETDADESIASFGASPSASVQAEDAPPLVAVAPVSRVPSYAGWGGRFTLSPASIGTLPLSPLVLSAGIVEILATLSPASTVRRG